MNVLFVILILVGLVIVHELGHFFVAKFTGVRVDEFGVGYPPRAFSLGKLGDTEYTINWLPFGGFVRIFGEDTPVQSTDNGKLPPHSFVSASRSVQAFILIAGVTMNIIVAWVLFGTSFVLGAPHAVDKAEPGTHLYITNVLNGSPALMAGISAGDEIISISDAKTTLLILTPSDVSSFIAERGGKPIDITYVHAGATSTVSVRPANGVVSGSAQPALGVGLALVTFEKLSYWQAFTKSAEETLNTTVMVANGLWIILGQSMTGTLDLNNLVGPVGLVSEVSTAHDSGLAALLRLAAFISVNLAVINLVPIPALDGGRLAMVAVEGVIRRPLPGVVVRIINAAGVLAILALLVLVTWHDIVRLLM